MEQRELEVTIISAQDLKNVSMFGKMTPYVVVWVHPHIEVRTQIARKGGVNPTWYETLKLIVPQRILNHPDAKLHIVIYNPRYFSKKFVGSCTVPLSSLKEKDSNGAHQEQDMSCELHRHSKHTRGVLDFSLKLGDVYQPSAMPAGFAPLPQTVEPNNINPYPAGYPYGYNQAGGNQYPQYPPQYCPQYPQSYPPVMGPPAPYYPLAGPYAVPPPPRRTGLVGGGFATNLLRLGVGLAEVAAVIGGGGCGGGVLGA